MSCFVTIVGMISSEPDLKKGAKREYASFMMGYQDVKKRTNWVFVKAFDDVAKNLVQYKKRGDVIAVSGNLVVEEDNAFEGGKAPRLELLAVNADYLLAKIDMTNAPANVGFFDEGKPARPEKFDYKKAARAISEAERTGGTR